MDMMTVDRRGAAAELWTASAARERKGLNTGARLDAIGGGGLKRLMERAVTIARQVQLARGPGHLGTSVMIERVGGSASLRSLGGKAGASGREDTEALKDELRQMLNEQGAVRYVIMTSNVYGMPSAESDHVVIIVGCEPGGVANGWAFEEAAFASAVLIPKPTYAGAVGAWYTHLLENAEERTAQRVDDLAGVQ